MTSNDFKEKYPEDVIRKRFSEIRVSSRRMAKKKKKERPDINGGCLALTNFKLSGYPSQDDFHPMMNYICYCAGEEGMILTDLPYIGKEDDGSWAIEFELVEAQHSLPFFLSRIQEAATNKNQLLIDVSDMGLKGADILNKITTGKLSSTDIMEIGAYHDAMKQIKKAATEKLEEGGSIKVIKESIE